MNHWFLVGRDIMWFLLTIVPLVFPALAVQAFREGEDVGVLILVIGIVVQFLGVSLLYTGVIR